jgi:exopolysaccharide biosynthesis polyprenyl glycosylphosphotransferase
MQSAWSPKRKQGMLLLGDAILLLVGLAITLRLRYPAGELASVWNSHLLAFSVVGLILLTIFYIDDVYGLPQRRLQLVARLIRSLVIGGIIASTFFYFATDRLFTIKPQRVLLVYLICVGILIYVWHLVYMRLSRLRSLTTPVLLLGRNALTPELIKRMETSPELSLEIRAYLPTAEESDPLTLPDHVLRLPVGTAVVATCDEHQIGLVVVGPEPSHQPELVPQLIRCLHAGITFTSSTALYEKLTGKVPVQVIEQRWFLENVSEKSKQGYDLGKRVCDIILAVIGLVISAILFPFIALAIKLNSRGPLIFSQVRTGKNNELFTAFKFRSMYALAADGSAEASGEAQWTTQNDKRVTPVGQFLRQTRLDELPQLWNVLRGEMSLIGPRPERPSFIEQLEQQIPFYQERLLVKPGLTGWAQVAGPAYGGSVEETLEKIQYDLYYIKHRSFIMDVSIILRTIRIILGRKGQ